jgi:DNA-binding HxlR family transcriptional regulator
VDSFRDQQFCPLARAAEILGHRWVLPILRELTVGPPRFSDFRRRLPGISSSMLADRLTALESQEVIARRELEPPAASTVYELTPNGRALGPALIELTKWGARFLANSQPGDHVEPDWLGLAVSAFGKREPTLPRRFELRPYGESGESIFRVAGGEQGTHMIDDELPVDVRVRAPAMILMGLMSGDVPVEAALASDDVQIEGDAQALSDLPSLFLMSLESKPTNNPEATSHDPEIDWRSYLPLRSKGPRRTCGEEHLV